MLGGKHGGHMTYRVLWKMLPEKVVVDEETHDSLEDALEAAKYVAVGGWLSVEVTVIDSNGVEHFSRLITNS